MILMYHHVAPAAPRDPHPAHGWYLRHTPEALETHIAHLRRRGWAVVSLDEYAERRSERRGRAKVATLTFDDGWKDNFNSAFPVLRSLDVPATFFVTTKHLGTSDPAPERLSASELRQLAASCVAIGGHTRTHPDLTHLDAEQLEWEIAGCRRDLARVLGEDPSWFAYPGGAFNMASVAAVRAAGWLGAVCSFGPGKNCARNRYWMYREVPGPSFSSPRGRVRRSALVARASSVRNELRVRKSLAPE